MPNGVTLTRIHNLLDGESVYKIRKERIDTGATVYRSRKGDWILADPSKPHGVIVRWPTLNHARHDLGKRLGAQYVWHPTGNGLVRMCDGHRPRDLTEALLLSV